MISGAQRLAALQRKASPMHEIAETPDKSLSTRSLFVSELKSAWQGIPSAAAVIAAAATYKSQMNEIHEFLISVRSSIHFWFDKFVPGPPILPPVKDFIVFVVMTAATSAIADYFNTKIRSKNEIVAAHPLEELGVLIFGLYGLVFARPIFEAMFASEAHHPTLPLGTNSWWLFWAFFCVVIPYILAFQASYNKDGQLPSFEFDGIYFISLVFAIPVTAFCFYEFGLEQGLQLFFTFVAIFAYFIFVRRLAETHGFHILIRSFVWVFLAFAIDAIFYGPDAAFGLLGIRNQ